MQLTTQNLNSLEHLYGILKDFPGLDKYQREIKDLKAAGEFAEGYQKALDGNTLGVEQVSGMKLNLLNPEQADIAKDWLEDSLKDVNKIMADKELMEKEPFLKAYLSTYKMQMNRAFSDRDDAHDYYADDTVCIVTSITDQFDKLPTGQEYQQMPKNIKQAADKLMNFMEAYSDCYEFQGQVQNAVEQNPEAFSDAEYLQAADQKMKKLQEATQRIAETPKKDVEQFFKDTKNASYIERNIKLLYEDEKHSLGKAAKQIDDRRKQLKSHMTPVEARLLENYGGQVKGIVNTAFGEGIEPHHLPQPYRELSEGIIKLGKDCRQKLEEGFKSEAEKLDFFKNLGDQTKAFCDGSDRAEIAWKELTEEQKRFVENISDHFRQNAEMDIGALSQAMKMGTKLRNVEQAANPEFAEQIRQFYDMMQATGSGYLGHTNSPEYTKMMNTAKVVTELAEKSPLNGVQRDALGVSFGRLSKDCQAYLAKAGIGKKSREVGEDRFAGALGILNLVDKKSAERVRAKAQAQRKTEVTFDGLQQRAQQKATQREPGADKIQINTAPVNNGGMLPKKNAEGKTYPWALEGKDFATYESVYKYTQFLAEMARTIGKTGDVTASGDILQGMEEENSLFANEVNQIVGGMGKGDKGHIKVASIHQGYSYYCTPEQKPKLTAEYDKLAGISKEIGAHLKSAYEGKRMKAPDICRRRRSSSRNGWICKRRLRIPGREILWRRNFMRPISMF